MRWKEPGLEAEFSRAHHRVQAMMLFLDWYCVENLGKDLMVTDVERTQAEYDAIYVHKIEEGLYFSDKQGVKHYSGPRPHLADPVAGVASHAVDVRTVGELADDKAKLLALLVNATWPRTDGKPSALLHDVGAGSHLHVQAQI